MTKTRAAQHPPTFGEWADRNFDAPVTRIHFFRLASAHEVREGARYTVGGESTKTTSFGVQHRREPEAPWNAFDIHPQAPGYALFAYSLAYCQWAYAVMNTLERGHNPVRVVMDSEIHGTEEFFIRRIVARLHVELESGSPLPPRVDEDYILGRAAQCPVSRNVGGSFEKELSIAFTAPAPGGSTLR